MLNRCLIGVVWCFSWCSALNGQISFSDYLKSSLADIQTIHSSQSDESIKFRAPLVTRWNFRSDTDEFLLDRQEYEIRADFSSKATRTAQNRLYQGYIQELENERNALARFDVKALYENWLRSYFTKQEQEAYKLMLPYLNDQLLLLKKVDTDGTFSLYDYLEKQKEVEYLEWEMIRQTKVLDQLSPDLSGLVQVDALLRFVESLHLRLNLKYPDYLSDQLDMQRVEDEYNLELAETKQVVDFFRVNYNGPQADPFEERVSVGFSMNFGRSEEHQLDLVELKYKKAIEAEQIAQRQTAFLEELGMALLKFRMAVEEYYAFSGLLESFADQQGVIDTQNPSSKRDLIKWLDLKIDFQENQKQFIRLEEEVFEAYIDWLDLAGLLNQYYSFDFLSPTLDSAAFLQFINR